MPSDLDAVFDRWIPAVIGLRGEVGTVRQFKEAVGRLIAEARRAGMLAERDRLKAELDDLGNFFESSAAEAAEFPEDPGGNAKVYRAAAELVRRVIPASPIERAAADAPGQETTREGQIQSGARQRNPLDG